MTDRYYYQWDEPAKKWCTAHPSGWFVFDRDYEIQEPEQICFCPNRRVAEQIRDALNAQAKLAEAAR